MLRQLQALRGYESDLVKEIAWHEQRKAHALMVMAGRGGMGPPASSMDRAGRPLPDEMVIGPSATDAAASLQTTNGELARLKPALSEIRRQIKQLEFKIQSGKRTVTKPQETFLSPQPEESQAKRRSTDREESFSPAPAARDTGSKVKVGKGGSGGAINPADF